MRFELYNLYLCPSYELVWDEIEHRLRTTVEDVPAALDPPVPKLAHRAVSSFQVFLSTAIFSIQTQLH